MIFGSTRGDTSDIHRHPDTIAPLLNQIRESSSRERAARELLREVHKAIYPLCLRELGNPDAASDAASETVCRLLARVGRTDYVSAPIGNGTAYVRQIARNVCVDARHAAASGRTRSLDELPDRDLPVVADAAAGMYHPTAAPNLINQELSTLGYTSRRAMSDLACLTDQERKLVTLRVAGYSYVEAAQLLGPGLSAETARTSGERGFQKLRGLVHIQVWQQEPPSTWSLPLCPELAALKAEVKQHLLAGTELTANLYRQVGTHLNPKPNRRPGDMRPPQCALCTEERERSRRDYWWLLTLLLPFPPLASQPQIRPVASVRDTGPKLFRLGAGRPPNRIDNRARRGPAGRRARRGSRARWAAILIPLLLIIAVATWYNHTTSRAEPAPAVALPISSSLTPEPSHVATTSPESGTVSTADTPNRVETSTSPGRKPQTRPPTTPTPTPTPTPGPTSSSQEPPPITEIFIQPPPPNMQLEVTVDSGCPDCYGGIVVQVDEVEEGNCLAPPAPNTCDWSLPSDTTVTISAIPGYYIVSWEDACYNTDTSQPCVLTLTEDQVVYVQTAWGGTFDGPPQGGG